MVDITQLPASPANGQTSRTTAGWAYTWDGTRWDSAGFLGVADPLAAFTLLRSSATDPTTTSTAVTDNADASIWGLELTRTGQPTPTDPYAGIPDAEAGVWLTRQDFNSSGTLTSGELIIGASRTSDQSWGNGVGTTRNTDGDARHFSAYNFFAGETDVTTATTNSRDWTFSAANDSSGPTRYFFLNNNVGLLRDNVATADRWTFTLSPTFSFPTNSYNRSYAGHTFDLRRGDVVLDGYWTGNGLGSATAPTGTAYTRYTAYQLYIMRTAP